MSTPPSEYSNTLRRKKVRRDASELTCFDQGATYLDRDKPSHTRDLAPRKKVFFREGMIFFSTFQLHEMKTIESIFAFSIICFSVSTNLIWLAAD
jgi:hypothetical protein